MDSKYNHYIPLVKRIEAGSRMARRKETGEKVSDIASELQVSRSHLYVLEEKYKLDQEMSDKQRAGRPLKIDDQGKRRIVRIIKKQPFTSSTVLTREFNGQVEEEKQISTTTFKRVAKMKGLKSYRPCVKPLLTPNNIRARLAFAREHQDKTNRFWSNVLFADETSLYLCPKDTRSRVRRRQGERYKADHVKPSFKYRGGSLMFWGIISWKGQGPLVMIEGTLNGRRYAEILEEWIPQILANLNVRPYLLEDHATSHDAQIVKNIKIELGLQSFENFPSNSPDLNPLEHIWSYWKDKIRARDPRTLEQLEDYAYEEWDNIPLHFLRTCIGSMSNRLAEVVRCKGLYTRY